MQIDENISYQTAFWKIQRVGWVVMTLILLFAVLGLLGGEGVMNSRQAGSKQLGATVSYEPYLHRDTGTELSFRLYPSGEGTATLFIGGDYVDMMRTESMMPHPRTVRADRDGYIYVFDSHTQPTTVSVYLTPDNTAVGALRGKIGSDPDKTVTLNQWVYP